MSRRQGATALLALLLLLPLVLSLPAAAQSGGLESATVYGFVVDTASGSSLPASGLSVSATRESFLGTNTTTDATGKYELHLPKGDFVLRVLSPLGDVLGRANISLGLNDVQRFDFVVDSSDVEKSSLRGTLFDDTQLRYREGLSVRLTQCTDASCSQLRPYEKRTTTDPRGRFSLPNLKAGTYELLVRDGHTDEVIVDQVVTLGFAEERNLQLHFSSEGEVFTPDYLLELLQTKTVYWVLLAVIITLMVVLLAAVSRLADRLMRLSHHLIDQRVASFAQDTAQWFVVLLGTGAVVWDLAQISFTVENFAWLPFATLFGSLVWILLIAVLMRLLLLLLDRAGIHWHHRVSVRTAAGLAALTPRMVTFSTLLLKNVVLLVGGLAILLTALAGLGKTDLILGGLLSSLQHNLNFIIFIIVMLIVATLALRVIEIWFEDIGATSSRLTPEMIRVAKGGARYALIGLIILVLLFTVLSAAGLGEVAQLLIIIISMMVGLVVSFAATGSIGNLLAGLVLQATRPFETGDWILVHDQHVQVLEVSLMYTRGLTFKGERVTLPNNVVLSGQHTNYSLSVRRGGSYALEVEATIGYDVAPGTVEALMVKAAEHTEGVLSDPAPHVVTTQFFNHAVGYQLRAHIREPQYHPQIRTDLMFNMLNTFHAAGVEILSPLWQVYREDVSGAAAEVIRTRSAQPRLRRTTLRPQPRPSHAPHHQPPHGGSPSGTSAAVSTDPSAAPATPAAGHQPERTPAAQVVVSTPTAAPVDPPAAPTPPQLIPPTAPPEARPLEGLVDVPPPPPPLPQPTTWPAPGEGARPEPPQR